MSVSRRLCAESGFLLNTLYKWKEATFAGRGRNLMMSEREQADSQTQSTSMKKHGDAGSDVRPVTGDRL